MRVPTYDALQVSPGAPSPVYDRYNSTGEEQVGAGLAKLGEGVARVGQAAYQYQAAEARNKAALKEQASRVWVQVAESKLLDEAAILTDPSNGFPKLQGDAAVRELDNYTKQLEGRAAKLGEDLTDDYQRKLWQVRSSEIVRHTRQALSMHAAKQAEVVKVASYMTAQKGWADVAYNSARLQGPADYAPDTITWAEHLAEERARAEADRLGQPAEEMQRLARVQVAQRVVQGYVDSGNLPAAKAYLESRSAALAVDGSQIRDFLEKEQDKSWRLTAEGAYNKGLQQWLDSYNRKGISRDVWEVLSDKTNPHAGGKRDSLLGKMQADQAAMARKTKGLAAPSGDEQLLAWIDFKSGIVTDPEKYTSMSPAVFKDQVLSAVPKDKRNQVAEDWQRALEKGRGGKEKLYEEVVLKACQDANRCPRKSAGGVNVNQPSTWPEPQRKTFEKALEAAHTVDAEYRANPKNPNKLAAPESEIQKRMTAVFTVGESPDTVMGWSVNREKTFIEAEAEGKADVWKPPPMPYEKRLEILKMMADRKPRPIPAWPENVEGFWRMSITGKAPKIRWDPMSSPGEPELFWRPAPEPSAKAVLRKQAIEGTSPAPISVPLAGGAMTLTTERSSPSWTPADLAAQEEENRKAQAKAKAKGTQMKVVP